MIFSSLLFLLLHTLEKIMFIFYSFIRQFKNSLNPSQRNMFNKLRVLSLIRCKLLKEVDKPITVDNINFGIFHTQLSFNDFKIKQYSHKQDVLKEIAESKIKNKTPNKELPYRKYISFTSIKKRNSIRNSFTDRNEDIIIIKDFSKITTKNYKYFKKKSKVRPKRGNIKNAPNGIKKEK